MKRYSPINFLLVFLLASAACTALFKTNHVFAVTCTQNGNTTYCSDPQTGKETTYNQYGDNIYGSDGSSATIYHDPVYNMGSDLPSVSTAGIDMDSPEMKEAQATYKEGCSSSGFNGGADAAKCRSAVVEWLEALSSAPRLDTTSSDDYDDSDTSSNADEDMDEWTKKLLSDFGITNNSSQSEISCVPNSHRVENNECTCDKGYINMGGGKCAPLTVQSCVLLYGKGTVPNEDTNLCHCETGYSLNSTNKGCFPVSVTTNDKVVENATYNLEIKPEDVLPLNETGNINDEAVLRECPSTQCSKVGSYPKGTVLEITGKYKNDTWFKVNVINSKGGWIHQSLVDEIVKQNELRDETSEPITMTRAEYDAKYPPTQEQEQVSWWKKIFNWFGF